VDNSFGFEGHIRDKLGIRGPKHVHVYVARGPDVAQALCRV